jgi:hypothetical protein
MCPFTPLPLSRSGLLPQGDANAATPPYSPDLVPADFFMFKKVKEELAGLHLS